MQDSTLNVLLIDDDHLNNFISTRYIRKYFPDSNIAACLNGKDAVDLLTANQTNRAGFVYDYILLDLNMPEMNGWEFLDKYIYLQMHKNTDCKVFVLTSSIHTEDLAKMANYPFLKDYVVKPLFSDKVCKIFGLA